MPFPFLLREKKHECEVNNWSLPDLDTRVAKNRILRKKGFRKYIVTGVNIEQIN